MSGVVFSPHVSQLPPWSESDVLRQRPSRLCGSGSPLSGHPAGGRLPLCPQPRVYHPCRPGTSRKVLAGQVPAAQAGPEATRPRTWQERRMHTRVQMHGSTHAGKPAD